MEKKTAEELNAMSLREVMEHRLQVIDQVKADLAQYEDDKAYLDQILSVIRSK